MKKSLLTILFLSSILLVGCDKHEEHPKEYVTYTININDSYVTPCDSNNISQCQDTFKTFINHDTTIVDNVTVNGFIQINNKNNMKYLSLSSTKNEGNLSLTFVKPLVSFAINASCYYSSYSYGGQDYITIENTSKMMINETEWDLSIDPNVIDTITEPEKIERTFDINSTTLSLGSNAGERVMIYSLSFIFEK